MVLDTSKACLLSRRQSDSKGIPGFCDIVPEDEYDKYIATYTPEQLLLQEAFGLVQMLISIGTQWMRDYQT